MDEQRIGLFGRLGRAGQRAALPPVLRILDRVLIRDLGDAQPLQPDAEPRGVHHDEHRREPLHLLADQPAGRAVRSEEHTSELQSLMRNSYAVFCLKKKKTPQVTQSTLKS